MDASPNIIDITVENFQSVVGEQSKTTPVLLEFYAEGAEQCASTSALLQRLASEYAGKFVLGRVEVQQNPSDCPTTGHQGPADGQDHISGSDGW